MEFTPITTQEAFDAAIKDRLARERETVTKKFADYDDLKNRVANYEQQIADLQRAGKESADASAALQKQVDTLAAQNKRDETDSVKTRIALELGLPYAMAARLTGEDEAAIRKDAEGLSALFGRSGRDAPLKNTDPPDVDSKQAALRRLTQNLTSKGD